MPAGIRTLADLGGDDRSGDDDERQTKYTGGHASGMAVEDGPSGDTVRSLFDKAQKNGAKEYEEHVKANESRGGGSSSSSSSFFGGSGFTLGDGGSIESRKVDTAGDDDKAKGDDGKEEMVKITFWKGGFSVGDGPFRASDDPASAEFLDAINRGFVPRELGNRSVAIQLEDRRKDDYVAPPKKLTPFSGGGMRLGTTMDSAGSSSSSSNASSSNASSSNASSSSASAASTGADPAKGEITSIQIRLHDGSRMVAKFNVTQRVGDIRSYICNARPEMGALPFDLQVTFPTRTLTDESATIADAGLKGAVIIQAKK